MNTKVVNVSIFDRNYIESLFGGVQYPDGTFVIDEVDNIIEHQKVFMEVVSDIFSIGRNQAYALMHSAGFPSITINNRLYVEPAKLQKWLDTYTGRTYIL